MRTALLPAASRCPNEQARRNLFLVVVNRAHAFSRLLEPSQRAFLGILASDFGQLEWKVAFSPDRNLAPEDENSGFDELNLSNRTFLLEKGSRVGEGRRVITLN